MNTQMSPLTNPFPGLRPFEVDENHLFFGREKKILGLQEKLSRSRFLAVMGPSGSGKSSLVRSGLISKLTSPETTPPWRVVRCNPGDHPIRNLAQGLLRPGPGSSPSLFGETTTPPTVSELQEILQKSEKGLVEAISRAQLSSETQVLILVDQFEELFRFAETERDRKPTERESQHFVDLLMHAMQQREEPLFIIMTMRSDFLEDCTAFEGLPEAINEGQYLIPRMTRDELEEAIRGPIELHGAKVSNALVDQLHRDMIEQNDMLPLMQHTMMRTWNYWASLNTPEEPIGLEHYEHVGTLHTALSNHADEIYENLPSDRLRLVCERIFKALTEKSAEHKEGIRRPALLGDLTQMVDGTLDEVSEVVEAFRAKGRSLLMPPPRFPLTVDTVVDISHESLMRIWKRLVRWSMEEREAAHRYGNIVTRALMWKSPQGGSLMTDPELTDTLAWQADKRVHSAWAERYGGNFALVADYLTESQEAEKKAVVFVRRSKRNRVAALVFALLVLIAIPISWWLLQGRNSAEETAELLAVEKEEALADRDSAIAEARAAREQMALAAANSFEGAGDEKAVQKALSRADSLSTFINLLQNQVEMEAQRADAEQERAAELRDSIVAIYGQALEKSREEIAEILFEARRQKAVADSEVMANQAYQLLQRNQVQEGKRMALAAYDSNRVYGGTGMNAAVFQALTEAYVSVNRPGAFEAYLPLNDWPVGSYHAPSHRLAIATATGGVQVSASINPFSFGELIPLEDLAIGLAWTDDGKYLIAGSRRYLYRINPETGEVKPMRVRGLGRVGIFFIHPMKIKGEDYIMFATDVAVGVVPQSGFDQEQEVKLVYETEVGEIIRQLQMGPSEDIWLATDHKLIQLDWRGTPGTSNLHDIREVSLDDLHSINVEMDFDALAISENNVAIGTTTGDVWLIPKAEIGSRSSARLSIYRHPLHRDGVTHLEFDDTGTRLLSTSFDNNAKLVLVEEGKVRLQEINLFHRDKVWWGSFCGQYMVTLHGDQGIRRWHTRPEAMVKLLR